VEQLGAELLDGAFGENVTTAGLDISGALIGETWRLGTAVLQVTSPRVPCVTFAGWMDERQGVSRHWVRRFANAGRPGAYLRVLEEGAVGRGDPVEVLGRPAQKVTVAESMQAFYGDVDIGLTASMGAETGLAVIQWILVIVVMVIYVVAWRNARREMQNQQPASVMVAPGKPGAPGGYPAPGVVYMQPGMQQAVPAGHHIQYVAQPGPYQLQQGQQQYAVQPAIYQMAPQNQAVYPVQEAQYGVPPRPNSMSPVQAGQPPSYQQVPQPVQVMQPGQQYQQPQQYQKVQHELQGQGGAV